MGQYIALNEDKQAIHKFKNEAGKDWEEVKGYDNIAMIVPKPFVVLDFDAESDAKIMLKIIEKMDLHCKVMKTDRGIHCWFRTTKTDFKNYVKARLAIGIYSDWRVCNKNAYVVIKKKGKTREWLRDYEEADVDYLPAWLYPLDAPQRFAFKGWKEGNGRNQELLNYILFLQGKGMNKDDIRTTLDIINQFVFAESLPRSEMSQIYRDEVFKDEEELAKEAEEKENSKADFKFHHEEFAMALMERFDVISINGNLYIYSDGYYQPNQNDIELAMVMMYSGIKDSQRQEVLKYLRIIADKTKEYEEQRKNPYIVNVKNGRLNLLNGELTEHSADYYDFCRIPVEYNPAAKSKVLDDVLNDIFYKDTEVLNLVEELVGSCMVSEASIFSKAFIFYGSGSNGKSTFFYLLRKFLGEKNVSSIGLDELSARFSTVELENKLANIGDDLNTIGIKANGTIKKLISGDAVQVERKGQQPYSFVSYATQIFATNELPYSNDKTDGMMRRLCFIPCLAKFGEGGIKKNPLIKYKIIEDEALSAMLNKAMAGIERLQLNGEYTAPNIVKNAKESYIVDNSLVLQWIDENSVDLKYATNTSVANIYLHFANYCENTMKLKSFPSRRAFDKEFKRYFHLASKPIQRTIEGQRNRYYVVEIE